MHTHTCGELRASDIDKVVTPRAGSGTVATTAA